MKYIPKEITKEVNVTPRHPLINFAYLVGTVMIISVIIFVALGFIADGLVTRLSPETERKVGQMVLHGIPLEEIHDDKRIQYLDELINSLPEVGETLRLPLTIHLLQSDVVNAAILPGGHVLVNTGLLEAVKSENELAFVLAHELGHFQALDPLKSLGRSLVIASVLAVLGFGRSESGGLPKIIPLMGQLTGLHYSRQQEKSADLYALQRVIHRYGHGNYGLDFFKRIELEEGQPAKWLKVSEYFSTHPLTTDRIEHLAQEGVEKRWSMKGEATPLPKGLGCPNMEKCEPG